MGTKEEVSSAYLESQKALTRDYTYPTHRNALVLGATHWNIGYDIGVKLLNRHFEVQAFDETKCDITDAGQVSEKLRDKVPDTLVISAAVNELNWFEDQETIEEQVAVNLTGPMVATQMFVNLTLGRQHLKTIVFIGSMAYRQVLNGSAPYCSTKAGLAHFARCLAYELTPKGYRVFIIHPSNVDGAPMSQATIEGLMDYRNLSLQDAQEYWSAGNLMPRFLKMEDVSTIVADCCTGQVSAWQVGTQIELTGGQR